MCYIWWYLYSGREFGTASLSIHQKRCAELWEEREKLKPKHIRKPLPSAPVLKPSLSIESHNQIVAKAFEDKVMKPCPYCKRTFLEDRLDVHLRSCNEKNPAKRVLNSIETFSPHKKQSERTLLKPGRVIKRQARSEVRLAPLEHKPKLFCTYCGERYDLSSKYCSNCGEERLI